MDPLKGVREMVVTFAPGELTKKTVVLSAASAAMIFWARLNHEVQECIEVLALNHKSEVLSVRRVARGTTSSVVAEPKEILWSAVHQRASFIVVGHNHPDHDSHPSQEDVKMTDALETACNLLGIKLMDHIVIGTSDWTSIAEFKKRGSSAIKAARPPAKGTVVWTRGKG